MALAQRVSNDPLKRIKQNVQECCNLLGKDQCVYGYQCKLFMDNPVGCRWFEMAVMRPELKPEYEKIVGVETNV